MVDLTKPISSDDIARVGDVIWQDPETYPAIRAHNKAL